uniref:Uncharacterized protein n=1 Tax=Vitrella brassicaformis TaxID=1169539 RepID=A0A7S1PB77_9ALVE
MVPYTAPGGGQFPSDYPSGSSYPPPFDTTVGTGPLPLDGADQQQRAAGTGEGEWVPRIMRGLGSLVAMPVYPRALRRGVHRWWHDFDAKYMKPVFGGSDSTAELNDTNAQEQGEGLPGGRRREDDIDHPPTNGAPLSSDAPVPLPPPGHTNGYVPPGR